MFYIQYVIEFIKYLYRNCPYMGGINDVPPLPQSSTQARRTFVKYGQMLYKCL